MTKNITYIDRPNGHPGQQVKCSCGWSDYWAVADGSAASAAINHVCGERGPVPTRTLPAGGYAHSPDRDHYPDYRETDSCSCFQSAPCGYCESQWDEDTEKSID